MGQLFLRCYGQNRVHGDRRVLFADKIDLRKHHTTGDLCVFTHDLKYISMILCPIKCQTACELKEKMNIRMICFAFVVDSMFNVDSISKIDVELRLYRTIGLLIN